MKDISLFLFVSALCRYHYAELLNILKQLNTHIYIRMYIVSLLPLFYFFLYTYVSCQLQENVCYCYIFAIAEASPCVLKLKECVICQHEGTIFTTICYSERNYLNCHKESSFMEVVVYVCI
jgi:hypothetical protein